MKRLRYINRLLAQGAIGNEENFVWLDLRAEFFNFRN